MKKREFYQYQAGPTEAFNLIKSCIDDVSQFEEKNENLGFNAKKFGDE